MRSIIADLAEQVIDSVSASITDVVVAIIIVAMFTGRQQQRARMAGTGRII